MKVIKKGRPQKGWSVKALCTGIGNGNGGCGATLLVEAADIYETTSYARGEPTSYMTFCCILCGIETDIKGVPINVLRKKGSE